MLRRCVQLVIILAVLPLCGCSVFSPQDPAPYDYRIANQVHPEAVADLGSHPSTADPRLTQDPMVRDGDVLSEPDDHLAGNGGIVGDDPLTRNPTEGFDKTNRPINNWYWVRGTVANGSITIKVNGMTIGRYSVKIDTEISDFLNKGANEITFVSNPTVPDEPVTADLNVVYAQQQPGDPPVLTYNTSSDMGGSDSPDPTQPYALNPPKPAVPGLPMPSVNPQSAPVQADGSTEQTLSFIAT